MRTITIAATKGGSGKSLLATALAVHVHIKKKAEACLLDWDAGQGSATQWHALREDAGLNGPALVTSNSLSASLRRQAKLGVHYTFIDCPPTLDTDGALEAAIEVADYILSPVRPCIFDVNATEVIQGLANNAGVPLGFVLTDVTTGGKWDKITAEAVEALSDVGHVFGRRLTHRPSYVHNLSGGQTGPETDGAAAKEVAALWEEVVSWMK